MRGIREHFDTGSLLVILITLGLFLVALIEKGFTHDMLLEAGVFLISVKLIMMAYKNGKQEAALQARLDQLLAIVERLDARSPDAQGPAGDSGDNNGGHFR
ncbi:MAG TPA: hypothetical protein VGH80_01450 [Xanthomonadaceae bacterium]|jgi:hypothetical protein